MNDEEKVISILTSTKIPLKNQEITEMGKLDRVSVNAILHNLEEKDEVYSPMKNYFVLKRKSCMVDVAYYFISSFVQEKCCGKCAPCRVGTHQMLKILTNLKKGHASIEDLLRLEKLSEVVKDTSMCGLGVAAPEPVIKLIHEFRDIFEAHIKGQCPTNICQIEQQKEVD